MKWHDFTHAVGAAAAILSERELLVIGSQAIHGSFNDDTLPAEALESAEIAVAALDDPDDRKSHVVSGAIGEGSPFHEAFGIFVDGVSISTANAPPGWRDRLVRVTEPSLAGAVALCLEPCPRQRPAIRERVAACTPH